VKAEKVREMSVDELGAKEHELQEQLFKLRMQKATGQLQNASRLGEVRRDIARVMTVLKEKRR
jgi:large subunit ribosomal protein L29